VSRQLNEWRNDQWSATLESLDAQDQSLWRMTRRLLRVPTPSPPLVTPGGLALSDPEKSESLADNLGTQFQPVTDPSVSAVIEMVNVALRSYFISPVIEPQFTTPDELYTAIKVLKASKAPGPNGIPNRVLKHLPKRAVSFLAHVFNAVLRIHHFPQAWKHARANSILKPERIQDCRLPMCPLVFWTRLLNCSKEIPLARIIYVGNERGLLWDE
jgi:hypothetical protein